MALATYRYVCRELQWVTSVGDKKKKSSKTNCADVEARSDHLAEGESTLWLAVVRPTCESRAEATG